MQGEKEVGKWDSVTNREPEKECGKICAERRCVACINANINRL